MEVMCEVRKEVKPIEVDYICLCGEGRMRPIGISRPTYPTQYLHKCTHCSETMTARGKAYPYIVYE